MANVYQVREKDWKVGATVYQIIVDRFAEPENLQEKKHLYQAPLRLRRWNQAPKQCRFNEKAGAWQHELDFWGGDLRSLAAKLDYLQEFSVDVLYLNPIFKSLTNHKYDTNDYFEIDPAYGSNDDFKFLVEKAHQAGIKVVLDGVFNHVGRRSRLFQEAENDAENPNRRLFRFHNDRPVCWNNVYNLPELDLSCKKTRDYIYSGKNSVVKHWLHNFDIDGWRLDVAYEFGPKMLGEISAAAREIKADAMVIGEIWNYPEPWFPAVDGVINLHARAILLRMICGSVSPREAMRMYAQMVEDCGIDHMLRAWLTLDNHDTPRLASAVKGVKQQQLARILQYTLPGSTGLYYGSEFGLKGKTDPEQRGTMPWHLLKHPPAIFQLHKKLAQIKKENRALRIGDFRPVFGCEKAFAFMRHTDRVAETIVVCANPGNEKISAGLQLRDGRIHDHTVFVDLLGKTRFSAHSGFLDVQIPAGTALILRPELPDSKTGYSRYKHLE